MWERFGITKVAPQALYPLPHLALAVPLVRGTLGLIISRYKLRGRSKYGLFLGTLLMTVFNLAAFFYLFSEYLWPFAVLSILAVLIPFKMFYGDLAMAPDIN